MKKGVLMTSVLFLIVFTFVFGARLVWADYPEGKIRFIVPFAPGGMADRSARTLVRFVNPYLGGKVYVETVSGAGGAVGWRECAKAPPDGYTMTILLTAIMVGPNVRKDFPSYERFDPICITALDSTALTAKTDSRFKGAADMISFAKAHPGEVTASIAGIGTTSHIGMAAFQEATGTKFTLVPYKGTGPAMVAAIGGHVDVAVSASSAAVNYVKGGKLRPLICLGAKRYPIYPDVPTAKELGYEVVLYQWTGVGVPKGTPNKIRDLLVEAFKKATQDKDYKKLMDTFGQEQIFLAPEEAGPWLKGQSDYYKSMAKKIGLKPE